MVSVTNHEVRQCECCQASDFARCDRPDDPGCDCPGCRLATEADELRDSNRLLVRGMLELAKALNAQRRENARLEATKRQLAAELKAAYRRVKPHKEPPVELGVQDRIWADSVRRALEAKRTAREVA
jgi:hypothetical protein